MGSLIPLSFVACLFAHATTGFCLVQESIPEGGSTLAGDEEEENITIICTLLREAGGPQQVTEWFIQRPGQSSPQLILDNPDFANFEIVGEPIPYTTDRDFRTNFTILRLTSDLDRAVISCGLGGINIVLAANFTLRIYKPPSLKDIPLMTVVEGGGVTTLNLELDPDAFPFPQFQWIMNGQVATNNTPRVTYGYPGVTFTYYDRVDSGTYSLTATNYRLDNTRVVVGMDMGSFSLDVRFPPEIDGPGDTQHVILERGDITLVCGTSVAGNPIPTISWTDNNGTTVSDDSGISGSDTLMLKITGITRNHGGNWTCSVENSVRDAEHQIVLVVVVVPPSPPMGVLIPSLNIGPTFVRVCWQAPMFLGVPEVSRYKVTATPVSGGTSVTARTTDGNSRDVNVTGLLPGTNYEFRVVAISEFGDVVGSSSQSDPGFANTTFTVPAPVCQGPPTSSGGVITVCWNYTHTGGLDLTRVVIAATRGVETTQLDVPYGILTDLSQMTLDVTTFTAGFQYTFTVTAYNELGPGTAVCDPVTHLIGIPQVPTPPTGISNSPSSVVFTVSTRESGTTPPQMFSFIVNITLVFDRSRFSRTLEVNDYIDGEARQFTIDGLMTGDVYLFSVQAQNEFGASEFSGNSLLIRGAPTITTQQPADIQLFQIVLSGVHECSTWVVQDTSGKLQSVLQAMQQEIEDMCQCGFSAQNILNYAFECSETNQNTVTFRGELLGTAQVTSSQLISYIERWITVEGIVAVQGLRLRVDRSCPVKIRLLSDSLCQPSDSAAVIGGVVAAVLAVFLVTVIVCVVVFVAVRRHKRIDKANIHSRKEAVKLSELTKGENEGITSTEESNREYEILEFEHISTKECGAYGMVPQRDADNIYEN